MPIDPERAAEFRRRHVTRSTDEEGRIALGLRPRTLAGFWFWLRYWSPLAALWRRLRGIR